jgi:hypothetical protein
LGFGREVFGTHIHLVDSANDPDPVGIAITILRPCEKGETKQRSGKKFRFHRIGIKGKPRIFFVI